MVWDAGVEVLLCCMGWVFVDESFGREVLIFHVG